MTNAKLISVFELYALWMRNACAVGTGKRLPTDELAEWKQPYWHRPGGLRDLKPSSAAHILYMCETAIGFVNEGRRDKAMRWLGFIQGVLVSNGFCTLDEVGKHSMPDPNEPPEISPGERRLLDLIKTLKSNGEFEATNEPMTEAFWKAVADSMDPE